jgi:hypothetical protein
MESDKMKVDQDPGPDAPNLHPPREGFSRGTVQGLLVALPLAIIILIISLAVEIRGGSGLAVTMDYIAAFCIGVVIVWVVGGLFELNGKILDIGVKGAGGAAIVLFLAAWVRPYYNSNSFAPYKLDVTLPADQSLSYFIDQISAERNANANNIQFNFGNEEAQIRAFRPRPLNQEQIYKGSSWFDVFAKISDSSPCLKINAAGNTLNFQLDPQKIDEIPLSDGRANTNAAQTKFVVCKL